MHLSNHPVLRLAYTLSSCLRRITAFCMCSPQCHLADSYIQEVKCLLPLMPGASTEDLPPSTALRLIDDFLFVTASLPEATDLAERFKAGMPLRLSWSELCTSASEQAEHMDKADNFA